MKKIATHNSCTGEKGYGLRRLFSIFACCQDKTISEQYSLGVRYFDIKVKLTERGLVAANGLWESERSVQSILKELNILAKDSEEPCYYSITFYGSRAEIDKYIKSWLGAYKNLKLTHAFVTEPYSHIIKQKELVYCEEHYETFKYWEWKKWLPIPYLWHKIENNNVVFNETFFKMVDFV